MKRAYSAVCIACLSLPLAAQDSLTTTMLNDVVVTGQFEPQSVRKSVYQVRTITYDRIVKRAPVNVQSILSTELGVRFSNDLTLGTSDISLMGMGGQNVKILLDGMPLLDRGATRESLNQIDVSTIERIEIVEGPMSVIYGSDALAGVINIITKKYDDRLAIEARVLEETAGEEYAAFSGKGIHNENVSVHWQGSSWRAGGGLTRNNFGGWQEGRNVDPLITSEWHPKDQWLANASVGYRLNDIDIAYRHNYLHEVITAEGNTNINTKVATDKQYETNRFHHQWQATGRLGGRWTFDAVAAYQDYTRATQTTTVNVVTGDRRLSTEAGSQDEATFTAMQLRGTFMHKLSDKLYLQPGIDVVVNEGAGERIDRRRTVSDYAAFMSVEYKPTARVNVRPGLRFMHNTVYNAPPVVPSVNTRLSLTDRLDLRLAYAYGFRAPALRELYFSFFDASHSIQGNPNLKAEYSNSITGSLAWQAFTTHTMRVTTTLGGFYNAFENMIDIGFDPADPQVNTYINVYRFRTTGVTLENNLRTDRLHGTLGASYIGVFNLLSEDDDALPALLWTPEINATVSFSFPKTGTSLSAYYKFTGKRSSYELVTIGGESSTHLAKRDAFHLADMSVAQKITAYVDLIAGVKNVLDLTDVRNSSLLGSGAHGNGPAVPMGYGRSYFLSLNFHFTNH